jgi:hypothetical protein
MIGEFLDLTIPVNLARKPKTSGPIQLASNLTQLALCVTHAHGCVQHIDKVRKSRLTIFGRVPIILRRDTTDTTVGTTDSW